MIGLHENSYFMHPTKQLNSNANIVRNLCLVMATVDANRDEAFGFVLDVFPHAVCFETSPNLRHELEIAC